MLSLHRRLRAIESRSRASPAEKLTQVGRLTPEQKTERERQFRKLYRELGMPWPPAPRDPDQVRGELMDMVERHRETIRKETA